MIPSVVRSKTTFNHKKNASSLKMYNDEHEIQYLGDGEMNRQMSVRSYQPITSKQNEYDKVLPKGKPQKVKYLKFTFVVDL